MATSGSFNTNAVGNFYFTISWNRTGYNSEANTHDIHYTVTAHNTPGNYRTVYAKTLNINGNNVYNNGTGIRYYDGNIVTDGNITIPSSNNEGDGNLNISFSAGVGMTPGTNSSGSGNWGLDRIPRYANATNITIGWAEINKLVFYVTTDRASTIYVRINSPVQTDWLNNGNPFSSNTTDHWFDVFYQDRGNTERLRPNTTYSFTVLVRDKVSGLEKYYDNQIGKTSNIATFSSVPNVNIGEKHNIVINDIGLEMKLKLVNPNDSDKTIKDFGEITGSKHSLDLPSNDIYVLSKRTNSIKLKYILTTTKDGNSYDSSTEFNANIINSNPIFSNFAYEDTNEKTKSLTNDGGQTIVYGYSDIRGIITTANKATGKNSADIETYKMVIGGANRIENYSSTSTVNLDIQKVTNNEISIYATDTRGNSTKVSKTANMVSYEPIIISNFIATRENNVSSETRLQFEIIYWNNKFSNSSTAVLNTIKECKYRYKSTSHSDYDDGETKLTFTVSGNKAIGNLLIKGDKGAEGFDIPNTYDIQLIVSDELSTYSSNVILGSGNPAIAIYKNKASIGGGYNTSLGKDFQIHGETIIIDNDGEMNLNNEIKANKKYILYYNRSGTMGTINLSESSANFEYVEVYFGRGSTENNCKMEKIYNPNGKNIILESSGSQFYYLVNLLFNNIEVTRSRDISITFSSGAVETSTDIYIYKIIGYR